MSQHGRLLVVVYTLRDDHVGLISARSAKKDRGETVCVKNTIS